MDDTLTTTQGWSPKGTRCPGERRGHRTQRVSMAAALCQGQVLAPLTFEGYCISDLIVSWIEQQLAPLLRAGQVVILDNASFHKSRRLREAVEAGGARVLFLPRYSPDLNDSEHLWPKIKNTVAKDNTPDRPFRDKVDHAFM